MAALFLVLIAATACGQDRAAAPHSDPDADHSPALVAAIDAIIAARTTADAGRRAAAFAIPDPDRWFQLTFGDRGAALARDHVAATPALPELAAVIRGHAAAGRTHVVVERFVDPADAGATGHQAAALAAMEHPTPLYSVRLVPPPGDAAVTDGYHLWSFVWADDAFRWIGKLRGLGPSGAIVDGVDLLELRQRDAPLLAPSPRP